jgi:hypothetical protein
MSNYPVELTRDENGTIKARIVGLAGTNHGGTEAEAFAKAADLLEPALMSFIISREDVPAPEPANGRPTVSPSLLGSLKLAICHAIRERAWRKVHPARAMASTLVRFQSQPHHDGCSTRASPTVCGRVVEVEARELEIAG